MKMKATVIHEFGDFDALKHEDIERPSPKPGHVLIKVLAAGVNGESTFFHQFFNIPVTEGVRQIPTHALQDHVFLKMPAFEGYVCHNELPLK